MTEAELEAWAAEQTAAFAAQETASMATPDGAAPGDPPPVVAGGDGLLAKLLIAFGFLAVGITASATIRLSKPRGPLHDLPVLGGAHDKPRDKHQESDAAGGHHSDGDAGHDAPAAGHGGESGDADHHGHPSPSHGPAKEEDGKALAEIDAAIRAGLFADGLALCRKAKRGRPVAYREGLCLEALGRADQAVGVYESAADPDGDPVLWAAAALGHARALVAVADHPAAGRLLARVELRSGHPALRGRRVLEECRHLRARLACERLGPRRSPDPFAPEAVAWPDLGGGIDQYLDWLPVGPLPPAETAPGKPAAHAKSAGGGGLTVHRTEGPPESFEVAADRPAAVVLDLLREAAGGAGLELGVSPAAAAAAGKSVAVEVDGIPLAEFVAALAEPLGLGWRIDGERVEVGTEAELPATRRTAAAAARRAPADHPRATAARLAVGNLAAEDGRWKEAAAEYRRFLAAFPHAADAVPAAYNLGLAALAAGELGAAGAAFLQVTDRTAGRPGRWADLGRWWAGRAYLDAGDPGAAVRPLRAALNGDDRAARSAAAVGLTAAYLLADDEDEARAVLRRNRTLPAEEHAALAGFFEEWFRYRAAPTPARGEAVLAALEAAAAGRRLGPAGAYLAGQAYRDLGLGGRMAAVYDAATDVRGRLAARMGLAAGDHYAALDRRADARTRWLAVAAADPLGLGPAAGLRLAELDARDGRADACVARCRALAGRPGVDPAAVLAVMGRGYERAGRYRQAAECFAGRVPDE
jgi:tetratricopeptide (TPR) repeat protein